VSALAGFERLFDETNPDRLWALGNMVSFLRLARRFDKAEPLARRTHSAMTRALGVAHRWTLGSLVELGLVVYYSGDRARGKALVAEAEGMCKRVLGEKHQDTEATSRTLAELS